MRWGHRELLKFSEHRRDLVDMSCKCKIDPEDLVCRMDGGTAGRGSGIISAGTTQAGLLKGQRD